MNLFDLLTYIASIAMVFILSLVQLDLLSKIITAIRSRTFTLKRALLLMIPGIAAVIAIILCLWPTQYPGFRFLLLLAFAGRVGKMISKMNAVGGWDPPRNT